MLKKPTKDTFLYQDVIFLYTLKGAKVNLTILLKFWGPKDFWSGWEWNFDASGDTCMDFVISNSVINAMKSCRNSASMLLKFVAILIFDKEIYSKIQYDKSTFSLKKEKIKQQLIK